MVEYADLTEAEETIFNEEWDKFVSMHFPERDIVDIFEDNKQEILDACRIAKFQLEMEFGGINARNNQFGWTPIQPNHLLATATPIYATNTWNKDYTTSEVIAMWADWIGSTTSQRQLSKYTTMIVIGFRDPVALPKVSAIKANLKGTTFPIWWVEEALRAGLHIYQLPKAFVIEKEQSFNLEVKVASAGRSELRPLGVMFAKGDHLRDKGAYAQV